MQGFDVESLIQIQCTIMYGCDSCLERCRTLNKVHRNFPFYFIALFLGWEQYIFNIIPAALETTKPGEQEPLQFATTVFINMDCLPPPWSPLDLYSKRTGSAWQKKKRNRAHKVNHAEDITVKNYHCFPYFYVHNILSIWNTALEST